MSQRLYLKSEQGRSEIGSQNSGRISPASYGLERRQIWRRRTHVRSNTSVKANSGGFLLPKHDIAVRADRNDKVCFGHFNVRQRRSMHVGFLVLLLIRKLLQVHGMELHIALLELGLFGWRTRQRPYIVVLMLVLALPLFT